MDFEKSESIEEISFNTLKNCLKYTLNDFFPLKIIEKKFNNYQILNFNKTIQSYLEDDNTQLEIHKQLYIKNENSIQKFIDKIKPIKTLKSLKLKFSSSQEIETLLFKEIIANINLKQIIYFDFKDNFISGEMLLDMVDRKLIDTKAITYFDIHSCFEFKHLLEKFGPQIWPNLRNFDMNLVSKDFGEKDINFFCEYPFKNLLSLNFESSKFDDEMILIFASNSDKNFPLLKKLNLRKNEITDVGINYLTSNICYFQNLEKLNLNSNKYNSISLTYLKDSISFPKLINLKFKNLSFDQNDENAEEYLKVFCKSDFFQRIRKTEFSYLPRGCSDEVFMTLFSNRSLLKLKLKRFSFIDNSLIGFEVAFKSIKSLILKKMNFPNSDLMCHIFKNKKIDLSNLVKLKFEYSEIRDEFIECIFKSKSNFRNLKILKLSNNLITDSGLKIIAKTISLKNLRSLDLEFNKLTIEGVKFFFENFKNKELKKLNFSINILKSNIESESLIKNVDSFCLERLLLAHSRIGLELLIPFSVNLMFRKLVNLNLRSNYIGVKGVEILFSNNVSWQFLKILNLESNIIKNEGVLIISKNLSINLIEDLNLCKNDFTKIGIKYLLTILHWRNLEVLDVSYNDIDKEDLESLKENEVWENLRLLKNNLKDKVVYV